MVELKTSKEKLEEKRKLREARDKEVYLRFLELKEEHSLSDAVCITANEFNLSLPTIYEIRKRMKNRTKPDLVSA